MKKPLRMAWRIEKNGRASHLVGTAHFFPYSFRRSLTRLIRNVTTVMFEGPLDDDSFTKIAEHGKQGGDSSPLCNALTPESIAAIDDILCTRAGGQTGDSCLASLMEKEPVCFESFTWGMRPYAAFFSIWRTYLGWKHSVDMEGYRIACSLSKNIRFLETLDEQITVLDNIPVDRLARQLNDVANWDGYKKEYTKTYLSGDLEKMMALTARFATRHPAVLGPRDRNLVERMTPVFEQEEALAFIGFPHVPGVTNLLRDAGYTVTQVCI